LLSARYLSFRLNLALGIDALDDDPAWQNFKASNAAVDSLSIARLPTRVRVISGVSANIDNAQPKHPAAPKIGLKRGGVPAAPTISVTTELEIPEIPRIVEFLTKLNESNLLTESRGHSNFYEFSIVRWVSRRNQLLYRNAFASGCATRELEIPHTKDQETGQFVPAIDRDVLLGCLTLRDVRELVRFEQPTLTNPTQIGGRVEREIEIAPGSLPRDLATASVVAQVLLFFVIMYFGAFAREAISSEGFPAQGTLFSAFSRSRWTLLVLLLALWTPFIASLAVMVASGKLWLGVCSTLILCAVCSVHGVFQRKSYFVALNRRRWTRQTTNGTSSRPEANEQSRDQLQ
jgi:hypothetical protein